MHTHMMMGIVLCQQIHIHLDERKKKRNYSRHTRHRMLWLALRSAHGFFLSSPVLLITIFFTHHSSSLPRSNTIMRTQRLLAAAVSRLLTSRQRKKSDFFPLQINKTHAVINHWSEKKLRLQHSSYQHSDTRGARVQNPRVRISMVNDFDDVQ